MPSDLYEENNPDWAPSLNMGYTLSSGNADSCTSRFTRLQSRKRKRDESSMEASFQMNQVQTDSYSW